MVILQRALIVVRDCQGVQSLDPASAALTSEHNVSQILCLSMGRKAAITLADSYMDLCHVVKAMSQYSLARFGASQQVCMYIPD